MINLEEKLKQLGYCEEVIGGNFFYYKWVNTIWRVAFQVDDDYIVDVSIGIGTTLYYCEDLNFDENLLLHALHILKKDLYFIKGVYYGNFKKENSENK